MLLKVKFPGAVNSTCSLNATRSDCCAGRSHDAKQINSDYTQRDK